MLRLRTERLGRGWSLRELSRRSRIPHSHLSNLERGKIPSCPAWRRRLSQVFQMESALLFAEQSDDAQGEFSLAVDIISFWKKDAVLRSEFGSLSRYAAFREAEASGRTPARPPQKSGTKV